MKLNIHGVTSVVLILLIFITVVYSANDTNKFEWTDWNNWNSWSNCSAPCGNSGVLMRSRQRCSTTAPVCQNNNQTTPCNRFCNNGGTPDGDHCNCPDGFTGTCCETHISCEPPQSIPNGYISGNDYYWGGVITFTCNPDYLLQGSTSSQCVGYPAFWSNQEPTCIIMSCTTPQSIQNGYISGTNYNLGGVITFTCNPNYHLQGSASSQCVGYPPYWSNPEPTCVFNDQSDSVVPIVCGVLAFLFVLVFFAGVFIYQRRRKEIIKQSLNDRQYDSLNDQRSPASSPRDSGGAPEAPVYDSLRVSQIGLVDNGFGYPV